ncbi:TadG family pilus assembly protein [Phenylobacterium terrae]|uniref:TadG family pilus assembly protein n=1 Tax=Phenylobacterium terrae TaxID=2665495 RepID=A0ABW4MY63_9CAUL
MRALTRGGRFLACERGNVVVAIAAAGGLLMGVSALAVDLGSVYLQTRKLQGMADLAAIAAARDLANAQAAAEATVAANGWDGPVSVNVVLGRYRALPDKAPDERFTAGDPQSNAARVELAAEADLYFAQMLIGRKTLAVRRSATAARADLASFSIGTGLAALEGGVANKLLSALTGGQVSLSLMDYEALAQADVELFDYVDALRTEAALDAGSFDEVLSADLTTAQALAALSKALSKDGQSRAASAAAKISAAASKLGDARLRTLLDLGPIGAQDKLASVKATSLNVSALDLAQALLTAAQGGRAVELDLAGQAPGLVDLDVRLAIGERPNQSPWLAVDGEGGVTIRTSQARIYLEAKALGLLGAIGLKPVRLPVLVELAPGEAKLGAISCPAEAAQRRVVLDVRPGVGELVVGDLDESKLADFKQELEVGPARLLDLGLIQARGSARASIGGEAWKSVSFNASDIAARKIKSVQTSDIAEATIGSLVANTRVTAQVGALPAPTIAGSVLSVLAPLGEPLDAVLGRLTGLLGVRLGEADVRVHGLRCRDAVLVA